MKHFLSRAVYEKYALLFFVFFMGDGSGNSYAQNFISGKGLIWSLDKPNEPRLKLKFGTSGINIGGYEGTTLMMENTTKQKLLVEVKLTIKDFCSGSKTRTVQVTIKPDGKIGGNTFMGGSEQYDYSTTCKEKKNHDSRFSTKIFTVNLEIVSVKDLTEGAQQSGGGNSGGGGQGNSGGAGGAGSQGNSGTGSVTGTQNGTCPTFGFKFSNTPSYNCVALEWWALSTRVNKMDANGNFSQSNDPEAKFFTIQFRKQGDPSWISENRDNTGRNVHTISGLDACTKYEVRLTTTCTNNVISLPSNILRFTTACNKPGELKVENIKDNTAQISSNRQMEASFPCNAPKSKVRIIEFKSGNGVWDEVICNTGSPCILSDLKSGTTYRVRARHKYGENLYSGYTNEVGFTTKGSASGHTHSQSSNGTFENSGNATGTLKAPAIYGPSNGEKISGYYVELSWSGVLNATSYEILIASNINFSNAKSYTTPNTKYPPSNYGDGPIYYWKVRSKGSNGKYSFWSPVSKFTFK